jgi:hypothetical protein
VHVRDQRVGQISTLWCACAVDCVTHAAISCHARCVHSVRTLEHCQCETAATRSQVRLLRPVACARVLRVSHMLVSGGSAAPSSRVAGRASRWAAGLLTPRSATIHSSCSRSTMCVCACVCVVDVSCARRSTSIRPTRCLALYSYCSRYARACACVCVCVIGVGLYLRVCDRVRSAQPEAKSIGFIVFRSPHARGDARLLTALPTEVRAVSVYECSYHPHTCTRSPAWWCASPTGMQPCSAWPRRSPSTLPTPPRCARECGVWLRDRATQQHSYIIVASTYKPGEKKAFQINFW